MYTRRSSIQMWRGITACAVVGLAVSALQAGTIVLQPGPEGKDSLLSEYYQETIHGGFPDAMLGSFGGVSNMRPVLEFDLSSVPAGFPLTQAILTLTEHETFGAHHQYRAHVMRITEPWNEMEVTWNHRTAADLWSTPGGTFAEEWATADFTCQQGYAPVSFDVTALVGAWLGGTHPNYGVLLMPETRYIEPPGSATNNYTAFITSDHAVAAYHPMLTLVPEPNAVALLMLGTCMMVRRRATA